MVSVCQLHHRPLEVLFIYVWLLVTGKDNAGEKMKGKKPGDNEIASL